MDRVLEAARQKGMVDERALQLWQDSSALGIGIRIFATPQQRNDADDIRRRFRDRKPRAVIVKQRLFDEGDTVTARKARQDLLRALPNEIPSQMGMDYERKATVVAPR
ncbi:MAG TPA: hypothetical protein VNG69_08375 [Casimicrobiaceae bacterium]|nr:hypothetical protein [Casimicrobiaceae bacterium]